MSSAAASPAPRPPGSSRKPACRSCCTRCARCAPTAAHKTDGYAELVCSNSFRSDDKDHNAVGLLHEEMRRLGSLVMRAADSQPGAGRRRAGGRPRRIFRRRVGGARRPSADHARRAAKSPLPPAEWDSVIIATGPLTSPDLAATIRALTGEDALAFFDAIAPIVHRDTIDLDQAWFQSRYDKAGPGGTGADYINCPLTREQYDAFVDALLAGDKTVVPRLGSLDALFRRLPADRSDGRARPRDVAPRPDEAVRPDQSARSPT